MTKIKNVQKYLFIIFNYFLDDFFLVEDFFSEIDFFLLKIILNPLIKNLSVDKIEDPKKANTIVMNIITAPIAAPGPA
tara:strand:+ start:1245 stop:1478 length:234 start_codon:yes stop_codon:yes gene_type:complete